MWAELVGAGGPLPTSLDDVKTASRLAAFLAAFTRLAPPQAMFVMTLPLKDGKLFVNPAMASAAARVNRDCRRAPAAAQHCRVTIGTAGLRTTTPIRLT
jgi:hypothetical protein